VLAAASLIAAESVVGPAAADVTGSFPRRCRRRSARGSWREAPRAHDLARLAVAALRTSCGSRPPAPPCPPAWRDPLDGVTLLPAPRDTGASRAQRAAVDCTGTRRTARSRSRIWCRGGGDESRSTTGGACRVAASGHCGLCPVDRWTFANPPREDFSKSLRCQRQLRHMSERPGPTRPSCGCCAIRLHLTGTKFGCGIAQCARARCYRRAARALLLDAGIRAAGRSNHRRGSAPRGRARRCRRLDPARRSECGYCQSAQIMSASALLAKNRAPSDA